MAWTSWKNLCISKSRGGMGFRDLRSFNYALLTKQLWRILTQPDSLLSKIITARYFPHGDIFRAGVGTRPSATWRSLLKARPFLTAGIRRRIGDGHETAIWADPWLCDDGNFKIITRRPMVSSYPDQVSDLIDQDTRTWKVQLIDKVFWQVDRERIMSVPIGSRLARDRWIWHYSQSGHFTVRSCYHNILSNDRYVSRTGSGGDGSSSGEYVRRWNLIWEIPLPPRIRIFLWRACSEILPTGAELWRRKVASSPICSRCGAAVETVIHALQNCGGMGMVWNSSPFHLKPLEQTCSMWEWVNHMHNNLNGNNFLLALIVTWKAWEVRNRAIHGDEGITGGELVQWCGAHLSAYQQAQLSKFASPRAQFQTSWTPPPEGVIKVNFDAAIPVGNIFYSVAMIARDWRGECCRWAVRKIPGRPKAVDCEAHAALEAIALAKLHGWNSIILEGDCLNVMNALKAGVLSSSSLGAYIEEILTIAASFASCNFNFIKRNGNSLAHVLAMKLNSTFSEGTSLPQTLAIYAQ